MYLGPETMMPLASAIAAITGAALLFWRRMVMILRSGAQLVSRTLPKLFGGGNS